MDRRHLFKRVYEPKVMSAAMAPDDWSSLCLEVCCEPGDAVRALSLEALTARCVESLIEMGVLRPEDAVRDAVEVWMPEAYPVYALGFEVDRDAALAVVAGWRNFLTCGRQGLFRYHAMTNEAMEMAEDVARFLDGDRDKAKADNRRSPWGQTFY